MQQKKKTKGFSIIELLVVIAIIASISAVALPQFATWNKERKVFYDDHTKRVWWA